MNFTAAEINAIVCGRDRCVTSQPVSGVTTDSRAVEPGQLFVAIAGEHHDGHDHVRDAFARGARAALVARDVDGSTECPVIVVENTVTALGRLAAAHRTRLAARVVAITGSNGKTTVKEMIAGILRAEFDANRADAPTHVLVTTGNLNNEIGLPLTVLQLGERHRAAVFEMGAAKPRDIEYLADIASPTIGVVTNAGAAHLAGFGNEEIVAATKGEMFEALTAGNVAVVNHDDKYASFWNELAAPAEVFTFGLTNGSMFKAVDIREAEVGRARQLGLAFTLLAPFGSLEIRLPMAGQHNVLNALAAVAAGHAAGASPDAMRDGLLGVSNVPGRLLSVIGVGGVTIYDDSYNANPVSVTAAIDFLADRSGETWLVLGDMAELGPTAPELHRQIGEYARESGISRLFGIGENAQMAVESFGASGTSYDDIHTLIDDLHADAHAGVTALVKGSRCMGLDRVVEALRAAATEGEGC